MNRSTITMDDVVINSQLLSRPSKSPDYQAERDALVALAQTVTDAPQTILQKLAEVALHLCRADTAGISLLESDCDIEVFRWVALAGVFANRIDTAIPSKLSPSGFTIDRNSTQLMHMPQRVFDAIKMDPPIVEALLVPFHYDQQPIGTIWVVAHDERRKFDSEDERIVKILGKFASAAWQLWTARTRAELAALSERQRKLDLVAANSALHVEIVEHKRAEDRLQQFNRNLETRVEISTRELLHRIDEGNRLQEQLRQSQKMESIGALTGGIAHDFNNLLNVIEGYADLIIHDLAQPQRLIEYVQTIRRNAQQGAALVRQLLTIARKTEVKFEPTEIDSLLQRLAKLLIDTLPGTFTIDQELGTRGAGTVMADANQVTQALLNLCINARDAMPHGGRLLLKSQTICADELQKRFPDLTSHRYVIISVSDTGSGMDAEIRSRIFDPFFTTKEDGKGTGLGLSMVHSIVRKHEGFIDVASEPGRGSTFSIYLPLRIEIPKDSE